MLLRKNLKSIVNILILAKGALLRAWTIRLKKQLERLRARLEEERAERKAKKTRGASVRERGDSQCDHLGSTGGLAAPESLSKKES